MPKKVVTPCPARALTGSGRFFAACLEQASAEGALRAPASHG
jgi:hypothetical protein